MAQGFVYVLHFDDPIAHAQHYIGSTTSPLRRLAQHASGHGSRLCRELHARGIGFRLASLHTTNLTNMRKAERRMKDQKNSSRYCKFCTPKPLGFADCKEYPFEYSRCSTIKPVDPNEIKILRSINEWELNSIHTDIMQLMSIEKDSLGFMPAGAGATGGIATLIKSNSLVVAMHGNRCVGFCGYTRNAAKLRHKIHMCCVSDPFRFMQIGKRMVEAVIDDCDVYYPAIIACTVRSDLSANVFWRNLEFTQVEERKHATSNSTLLDYQRLIDWSNATRIIQEVEQ